MHPDLTAPPRRCWSRSAAMPRSRTCARGGAGVLRRGRRPTRDVPDRSRAGSPAGTAARGLEDLRRAARRNQRSLRGDRTRLPARTWIRGGRRQRRRRLDRPRACDRCDRRGADDAPAAFDEARWPEARRGHAVHRRRPRNRAGARDAVRGAEVGSVQRSERMDITGKTALVTGANRGIGSAIAAALLAAGATRVYAAMRSAHAAPPDSRLVPLVLDVTDAAQVEQAARACGDVQILVNNAGIALGQPLLAPADPVA